jgi:hypothetical protein
MHIAIDIDGTLTAQPASFVKLMMALMPIHRITLLTGTLNSPDMQGRLSQVAGLGIARHLFTEIVICAGKNTGEVATKKGEFCRDQRVDMVFEDTSSYLTAIHPISPNTARFLIQ